VFRCKVTMIDRDDPRWEKSVTSVKGCNIPE